VPPANRKVRGRAMQQDEQVFVSCGDVRDGLVSYVLVPL
jgi:hypothetical protein